MFHNGFVSICLRAASLAVPSAPLFASNLWFAKDMPIAQMNDADIAIMSSAIEETLTNAADGVTQRWSNPDTGSGGTVTPLSTSQESGSLCRQLQIENKAGGKSAQSVLDYFRQADGSWKMQTAPPRQTPVNNEGPASPHRPQSAWRPTVCNLREAAPGKYPIGPVVRSQRPRPVV